MIQLDIRTLSFLAVLVSVLMAGAMVLLWRMNPEERSVRFWAFGNCAIASGFLLIGLRGMVPVLLSVPVANSAIALGYALLLLGVWSFLDRPLRWWVIYGATAGVFGSFLFFTYVQPDIGLRIVIISLLIAALSLAAAVSLLSDLVPHMRQVQRMTAWVFLLHALYLILRAVMTLAGDRIDDLFSPNLVHILAFLDVIVVAICLTFAFTALVNRRLQFHLDHLASYDLLTEVFNRRAFEQAVAREIARGERHQTALSLLILDVDHFKPVNDRYGHQVGDRVLAHLARTLRRTLRVEDVLGRLGGEEFAILLPETGQSDGLEIAERLRHVVADSYLEVDGLRISVTVSIGSVTSPARGTSWNQLYRQADEALYKAKQGGRNLIAV